jgi:hypothetical protein
MILLYHSLAYTQRNVSQHAIEIAAHPCLLQHHLQDAINGIVLATHQLMNG